MNGAGGQKRRSARLSHEGNGENEPPSKKAKVNGTHTTSVSTKEQDGDSSAFAKKRARKGMQVSSLAGASDGRAWLLCAVEGGLGTWLMETDRHNIAYDEEIDGFSFSKGRGKKAKGAKQPTVRNSDPESQSTSSAPVPSLQSDSVTIPASVPEPTEDAALKTIQKKARRRLPTSPEREAAEKPAKSVRRSKRLSNEKDTEPQPQVSPQRPAHARSHANTERSPSPEKARPVTVEKKRKKGPGGAEEEEKIMRIALPFQDTPVIRRNKEMRKSSADGHRRSSFGMRGRRASSLIDEGRGNGKHSPIIPTSSRVLPSLAVLRAKTCRASQRTLVRLQLIVETFSDAISLPSSACFPFLQSNSPSHKTIEDGWLTRVYW